MKHIYEVTETEVVNPYDNSIKTQSDEKELTLFTCSQKGTMVVTLGNWLNGRLSCEQIEQLWCELIIPKQNKEQKESEE